MTAMTVSPRCEEIFRKKDHALIGISPFNSYYSEDTISELVRWGNENFKDFHLFVPDSLPYFNFLAMGYSHDKSLAKTKKQNRYLFNKIRKALARSELDTDSRMVLVSDFSESTIYNDIYNIGVEKYHNDENFKEKCHDVSRLVLSSYTADSIDSSMLYTATKYLFGELPFLLDTPSILEVENSIFVYHEAVDFFVNLYKNREKGFVADDQGYLILKLSAQ